jgi:hypothetical protein
MRIGRARSLLPREVVVRQGVVLCALHWLHFQIGSNSFCTRKRSHAREVVNQRKRHAKKIFSRLTDYWHFNFSDKGAKAHCPRANDHVNDRANDRA